MMRVAFILFMLCSIVSFAHESYSTVNINTNPEGYHIFISGRYMGKSNMKVNLGEGEYVIKISKSKYGWNSTEIIDTVLITADQPVVDLNYSIEQKVKLETVPEDVYIYRSDSLIAHTPALLPKSLGELKLWKPEYESRIIDTRNVQQSIPLQLKYLGKNDEENFVDSPWFNIVIGSTILFGATAAYFKIQADQKYDDYLVTHDSKLLDEVDRYDLYSGIAFGILQVNFGILIYNFLFEKPTE